MPIQKNIPSSTLEYIIKLLVISFLIHTTSCDCSNSVGSKRNPSHNNPHTPPATPIVPKLKISSLNYESTTGLISCMLQSQDKKNTSLVGELKLQITPSQGTQSILQGVTLRDGKYTITLDKKLLEGVANITKTFTVEQPATELASEFTFQIIYVDDKGVEEPVGSPETLVCSQLAVLLKLKDLKVDVATGQVTCSLLNQSKKPVTNVIIHWENKTNSAQIMQGGKAIQEIMIGKLKAGQEPANQVIGNLDFGGQASASFIFWVTCMGDEATRHSEQTIKIANSLPVKLTLEPVGPTRLETDANKVFKVKVVQQADSGSIDTSKVAFKITQKTDYPSSSAKILYNNKPVTSLIGTELTGSIPGILEFVVDPGTEKNVILFVELLYDKEKRGKVRVDWYKQEAKDAFEAMRGGDFEAFQKTLDRTTINNNDPNTAVWGAGDTLLTRAIYSLDRDIGLKYIEELLEKGADPNTRNSISGLTPLHYAIINNRENIVDRLLADDKLNLMIPSQWGYSPFHAAVEQQDATTMQKLLDKLQNQGNNKKQITDLLNTKDTRTGKTPLHLAAAMAQYNPKSDTIQLLLKCGADPDMLDNQNNSPLYRIIHNGNIEAAKALLQVSNNKINQQNKEGDTPLHAAVWTGKVEMVQLLLDNGAAASIHIKNNKGLTPAGYLSDKEGNFRFMSASDQKTMKELLTPTTP